MENPNEAKVVKVHNPFDFDYTHAYGGVPYQLRAGSTQLFPWAIGDHLATHLARQAMIRKAPIRDENARDGRGGESERSDRPLWDEQAVENLKKSILTDAFVQEQPDKESDAEMWKRKFEELNAKFPQDVPTVTATGETPEVTITNTPSVYKDKAEVIEELKKRNITFDARSSKATLEKLLA